MQPFLEKKQLNLCLRLLFLLFFNIIYSQDESNSIKQIEKEIDSLNIRLQKEELTTQDRLSSLNILSHNYVNTNRQIEGLNSINKLEKLAIEKKDTFYIAVSFKLKGFVNGFNGNDDAILNYNKAIKLFESLPSDDINKNQLFATHSLLADYHTSTNKYGEASKVILKSFIYLSKRNDSIAKYFKIDALNTLGFINSETENNSKALQNLKEALILENEINDEFGKANTYNAIAIIYSKQKNETKALEYYQLALDIYKKLNRDDFSATIYNNVGISYYELKQYDKARNMLLKSIELGKKNNHKLLLAESHLYIGKSYIAEDKIDLGLQNIEKSLQLTENNSPTTVIENLLVKAEVANKFKNTAQALAFLNESLLLFDKTETIDVKKRVYKNLATTYEKVNPEKATLYNNKYEKISDSIRIIQRINQTEVLKAEFNYLKIQADLKNKEADLLLAQEKEKASDTKIFFITSVLTLLILFLVITVLRQKKLNNTRRKMWQTQKELMALKHESSEKEISFKNQQITNFAIHISEKNDLLEHIKQKIKRLPIVNKTTASQINDVIVFINDDINQNKEKVQLYSEIDETKDSFNHKLTTLYPTLTEKERRIATLIRLSHTSKQISLQLNITPASVDNYRSIIRKKINIPKGNTLSKFIKAI